jgi:hypothetical protein
MSQKTPRRFEFPRDTFAFANELLWEYQFDAGTGKTVFRRRDPGPDYAHRCFVLVRAARQFLYHARFDAGQKVADEAVYRQRVRAVVSRSPRTASPLENQIVIPGYAGLREFSAAHEKLLKAECGGAWRSYVLRSHWRMVLPISRSHQERTAERLYVTIREGVSPLVHLVKFPALTINHGMILFSAQATETGFAFSAYDPNQPAQPSPLAFDRATKAFFLPRNSYWAGGRLDIIEIYRGWFL